MCDLDLLKKSISEDAKVALMNNLGPQNFERPTPNQPLVYTGDNASVASIADNTVSSWASKRFGPKFSANWVQTQRDNNRTLIDIRIPEILDLALNVKYGGTSLQTANNILKGVDEDDLETRLSGYIKPGVLVTPQQKQQDSLFGLDTQNQEKLEFHINTLHVVGQFLENIGVELRLVPNFLSQDGSIVEGAIAAANFIDGTVDIIENVEKRPSAWNKLPEEAAHWWYRLLDTNSSLKKALWESHQTALKNDELYKSNYGKLVSKPEDLTEESIGQLIAEAIKRIETKEGSPSDYSFFKKFLEWINKVIDIFKNTNQDPFEVAAMKILSSDMSDLMTWEEYSKLNNIVNFADVLTEQSVAPIDYSIIEDLGKRETFKERIGFTDEGKDIIADKYIWSFKNVTKKGGGLTFGKSSPSFNTQEELDNWVSANIKEYNQRQKAIIQEVKDNQEFFDRLLNKSFRKKSKYLPKTLRKYFEIIDAQNLNPLREWNISKELAQITKKLSDVEKEQIIKTNGYTNIAPTLKVLPDLLQKYRKNPIVLSESIKIDGAKKQELSILNGIREMIKLENPKLKSITAEEFVAEAHNWLQTNYLLGFANENNYLSYRTNETFSYLDVNIRNLTEEEIQRLPFEERQRVANIIRLTKQNPDVYHNKVSLRFNDTYHENYGQDASHFPKRPSAWGNLTYFYTGRNKWKDAVLLHEIQNDNIEALRNFKAEKLDLETSLGRYLQQLNEDLLDNISQIESGRKKIQKTPFPFSVNPPKQHLALNYQLQQLVNQPLEEGLQQLKENLKERIDLYKSDNSVSTNPEKAIEELDKAYLQKRIFTNFQKRGGIKSLLSKEDLQNLKEILNELNRGTVMTDAVYLAEENQLEPGYETIRDLKQKKKDFKLMTLELQAKITRELQKLYGDDVPLLHLVAPAKPLPKSQRNPRTVRRDNEVIITGNSSQELNESVNFLIAFSEKQINKELSKNIEESKKRYIQARNATTAYNFNVRLSKITLEQYTNLIENYKYNQDLLNRLIDEQANKDLKKESIDLSKLSDDEIKKDIKGGVFSKFAYKKVELNAETIEEAVQEIRNLYNKRSQKLSQEEKFEKLKQQALDKKAELEKNYGKIEEEVKQTLEIEMNYFTPLVHHLIQKHINQYGKDFPMYFSGYNITKLTQGNNRTALIYAGKDEVNYTQREAKEIKYKAAQQIGLLSNDFQTEEQINKLSDSELEEGIKKLNAYKKQSIANLDKVINTIMYISGGKPIETGAIYNAMSQISGVKLIWQDKIEGLKGEPGGYLVDLSNYNYNVPILFGLENISNQMLSSPSEAQQLDRVQYLDELVEKQLAEGTKALVEMGAATTKGNETARATEGLSKLVDQINNFAERIGVEYEILSTVEEAANVIGNANTIGGLSANSIIASGAPAFFYNGKVYFIAPRLSMGAVFHEFSHPIIKALSNVEGKKLFNSLYEQAIGTSEGQQILNQMLSEFPEGSQQTDDFKEELIIRALDKIYSANKYKNPVSKDFDSFTKKLFFAIKQFLRKVFGVKIKVENLSPSTTLEELAAMITGDKFSIDIPKITREDFVAFSMASKNQISEINKINDQSLFDLINDYQTTLSSIRNDIKTKNLTELKKLLVGDADRKMILSEVLSDLYSAKKNSEEFIRTTTSTTLAETQKTLAANTLARNLESISNIADILLNSIENINPTGLSVEDQKAFAGKIQYAGEIVSYLEQLFQNTQSAMKEAGIKEDTPEWQTITLFFGKLPALKTAINAKMISILSEVTSSLVTDMRDAIKRQAIADFKKAIRNNPTIQQKIENGFEDLTDADLSNITPQVQATILRSYKNFKSDYEAISKEALNDILSGNYKDNSRLNTLLESYTNNQNPVIGSFAAFYKQQQASAEALTVREAEDFMKGLRPLVEGMSQEEIANLGKDLAFEDKTFIINKDGDVEEKIVLTYLNRFKNYRFELKRREVAFEKANRNGTYAEKSAAYQELQDFKRKYFWQEYTQEYYTLDKIYQEIDAEDLDALYEEDKDLYEIKPDGVYFEGKALENPNSLSNVALIKEHISNIIGSTAFLDKQVILDSLNSAQRSAKTETELFEKNNEIEALQRMYRQLFSMTYEDGVTLKTGKDLIKTKLHIKYREKSNSFVEYKLIDGAFERSLRNFLDELALRETPGTDEYYKERDEWIRQNSQIEFTEDYYEERRQAIERLKAFTESKLPDSPEARLIAENYKIIYSMLSIFKDTDNAPDAIEMGPKRIANIKRLMEEIQDARDNMAIKNGLTKKEDAELQTLWAQIKSGSPLTVLQQRRFNELSYKQTKGGLSKADKNTYNKLIADVSSLTEKVPTQQYLDALNYWLNTRLSLGLPEITEENANEYLDYDKIAVYFKRDPDFKNWFEANHILTEYYDYDLDDLVYTYKRVSAWEMARPSDEVYLKETQLNIIDEKTGKPMVLKRVPKARFKKRVVKDEFRLVKQNEDWTMYIGKYFDNRGRYLPRDYVPGDPNSAEDAFLINEKYDELRVNDPKKFAILEYMKKQQIEQESKLDQNYAKLYLDIPRYFLKAGIERRKEARRDIKRTVESVKRAFSNISVTDDVSAELLADDTLNMTADLAFVETDVLGNRREIIPIGGMSSLETNQVSKDVIRGHLSRIIDIAKFNVLQDTSSVAKAFVSLLNNNDPKDMNSIDRRAYQNTGKLAFTKSKSKSNTAGEAMAYFYEREYLGKKYSEEVNPYVDQLVKGLMKQVSFGYFALDLASAAKNYFSQLIQNGIETAGGEYLDVQSLAMGKAMAYAHTSKNLFQRLDRGSKDLSTQMILAFDPIQDRYKDDFADSYTNSVWNELASLKLFMAPRRFLERESVLELFFGMMSKKLIDQTLSDGTVIKIRYSQAFETDSEGNMVLKKGVDERYAVGGSEFAKFRIVVQEKSNLLYGTYAKMDQPMAQKYFAFRLMSWLRRYFTSMFINRWGFKLKPGGKLYKASSYQYRYNWALNEMTRGFYIESMITLVKTLRTFGTYLPYMSRREAVALRKTLYDALAATLLAMLPKLLFGYDGGDDERFEKLKALSGPLGSDNFKIDGWLTQHAIYQMKAVFGETTTFVPIPGLGEQEIVDVGTVSNVLLGRGIGNYTNLLMDLYYISTGDERAQYRRDMGPFPWQDKGDYKIYNHIGKMFGVKGKFWDPVLAIKAQETIEAMGQAK